MKKIEAIIRKSKFEEVRDALHNIEVNFLTYWDVTGVGNAQKGHVYRGVTYSTTDIQRRMLSIVVSDTFVAKTVKVLLETAYTGEVGDGKIFVLPIEEAYRIRTQEKGTDSLQYLAMNDTLFSVNNLWMMLCIALVFIMHLGFSLLEIGLTRSKNTINILFKNVMILIIGLLSYTIIGFNLMYPGAEFAGAIFGFSGFGLELPANGLTATYFNGQYTYWTDFLFQAMFAATAATIVSGAIAERIKLGSFIIFSALYVGIVYPIVGMWKWGGGFLNTLGFYDFAGSTIVHSVGGWAALVAVWLLGSRIGKFRKGKISVIPGHNMPLATAGVFLLWFGWFGFNGGSVLSADPGATSLVLVTTCLAAASGGFGAFLLSYLKYKQNDLSMVLNGILGGLVSITAGADQMGVTDAIIIGFVAGLLIVLAVALIDRLKLDDPVGAISVHLICGIWGTLAVGMFGKLASGSQFLSQIYGFLSVAIFCLITSFLILFILKKTLGLRVSRKEEMEGLDIHEHGMNAYPDFRLNEH